MEIAKLALSLLTPFTIAVVGYFIQRTLAKQTRSWKVQERIADKRVQIYESIAEDLNKIYCYVMDVGDFKNETPDTIIAAKRNVDKYMYMYQAIWPEETFKHFEEYTKSSFATYQGAGEDAKIRAGSLEKKSAHNKRGEEWLAKWENRFTEKRDPDHQKKYQVLMNLISRDLMHAPSATDS